MISYRKEWYYLTVKQLSAFLRVIRSKYDGYFYYLNFPHLFRPISKPELHKKVCKTKDLFGIVIVFEDTKI